MTPAEHEERVVAKLLATHGCAACPSRYGELCTEGRTYKSVRTWVLASMQGGSPTTRPLWCGRLKG
jgi:hypothetical protein